MGRYCTELRIEEIDNEKRRFSVKSKKFLACLTCATVLAVPNAALAESTDVTLYVGDEYVQSDEAAGQVYINDEGRTMIPLRVVSETMGYTTDWHEDGTIYISSADGTVDVILTVGSVDFTSSSIAGTFETEPTLRNDRVYLPARDFSELYGSIYWDNESRSVWIENRDMTTYRVLGNNLLRADADGITPVTMPAGYAVSSLGKPDQVANERVIDGVGYVAINYNMNHSQQCPLFRDDGDHMTYLATINGSSSFWVDGDALYYTHGTDAGPWSNYIDPNRLCKMTLGGEAVSCDVGFAINACTISVDGDVLTAVDADGVIHEVNLNDCLFE